MANKSQKGIKQKKKAKSKQDAKKKTERSYGAGMGFAKGDKQTINRKRHRGSHTKGTRKGQGK